MAAFLFPLLSAGSTPVMVERTDPRIFHTELTGNVLTTGELSDFTLNILPFVAPTEHPEQNAETAIETLRRAVADGIAGSNAVFAMAELSFKHAETAHEQSYCPASALYS